MKVNFCKFTSLKLIYASSNIVLIVWSRECAAVLIDLIKIDILKGYINIFMLFRMHHVLYPSLGEMLSNCYAEYIRSHISTNFELVFMVRGE